MSPPVTAILTLHDEGISCVPTIRSIEQARDRARTAGVKVDFICYLDRPSHATLDIVARFGLDSVTVDFGDQGRSRNQAVKDCASPLVAFMDGDDLCSANWLTEAAAVLEAHPDVSVVNPEFYLFFGLSTTLFRPLSSTDDGIDLDRLAATNLLDALAVYRRDALLQLPFADRDLENGYAYEDWQWYLNAFAMGMHNSLAPGTLICKRRRRTSQNRLAREAGVVVRPCNALTYTKRLEFATAAEGGASQAP